MKKLIVKVYLVWVVLFTLFAAPAFAIKDDAIQSQEIAEADGTSGQDTNLGDGIKTGHIQDGAITNSKISDVSISKVTGLDATLATKADQVDVDAALSLKANQSDLDATNTVVAGKADQSALVAGLAEKANQAVVDAALSLKANQSDLDATNTVVAGKADQSALVAGLAEKADVGHSHFYGGMAVVATSGGEYSDPVAAMNDLEAWCGTPSSTNPCLLKILPGVYDIGTGSVNMSSYVDIEGSGRNTTVLLKGSAAATNDCVVRTTSARNSEIRMLTITRVGQEDDLVSALYGTGNNITISDVSVVVTNGNNQARAIVNKYGNITLKNVDVDSSQIAIDLSDNDNVEISNSNFDGTNSYASAYLQGRINDFASIRNSAFVNRQTGSFTRGLHIVFYPIPAATNGNEFEVVMQNSSVYAYRLAVLAVNGVNLHMSNMDIESSITAIEYSGASTTDISNSRITGNIYYRFDGNLEIANTKLTGGFSASSGPGTVKCFGVYDENLAEVICP